VRCVQGRVKQWGWSGVAGGRFEAFRAGGPSLENSHKALTRRKCTMVRRRAGRGVQGVEGRCEAAAGSGRLCLPAASCQHAVWGGSKGQRREVCGCLGDDAGWGAAAGRVGRFELRVGFGARWDHQRMRGMGGRFSRAGWCCLGWAGLRCACCRRPPALTSPGLAWAQG